MAAVTICSDFGAQKKSATVSTVYPYICHEVIFFQNSSLEGHVLNFPFKNSKIATTCLTTIDRRMLDLTKKKIPRIQGQRRSPNNTVGREQLHLKSNLRPARDAQRLRNQTCAHQDRREGAVTTTDWTGPAFACSSVSCGGSGSSDLGGAACGIRPLGGGHHSVQSLSHVWLFVTSWTAARQASLSITNSQSLLRLTPIELVTIQPSHPLSSSSPPAFNLSQHQGLFKWVSSLHQVAKVLEFKLQHQSFQWMFKDWFPLGWTIWISLQTLKSLQHLSSKASILQHSAFFLVQLPHPYVTTGKT